jgi:phenylacetate-CoA ligase
LAFEWRNYNMMGYKFNHKCAVIRGAKVDDYLIKRNIFYQYDPREKYFILSSFHLNNKILPQLVQAIIKYKTPFLRGYPSSLEILADYILKNEIKIDFIKGINCSSENLFDYQRALIEAAFNAQIYDKFGNSEQTNMATQCNHSNGYHIVEEYGITELIDRKGNVVPATDITSLGEVVGTGFSNYATPFIRYKTEDYASYMVNNCPCKRSGRMFKTMQGRWFQQQVVTKDNALIAITALNSHSDVFDKVKQFQYYQDKIGELVLRLVVKKGFSARDEEKIKEELSIKLGESMFVKIRYLNEIPRTDRGKYKFLVQELMVNN